MQCMSSVNCSKNALLVGRPSVLRDWTRCTTCGITWDSEGWREKCWGRCGSKTKDDTANINQTNLQPEENYTKRTPQRVRSHFLSISETIHVFQCYYKLPKSRAIARHLSASHTISGIPVVSLGFWEKTSMRLWSHLNQKRRKWENQ